MVVARFVNVGELVDHHCLSFHSWNVSYIFRTKDILGNPLFYTRSDI